VTRRDESCAEVLYEICDGIATVTINRPGSANALNAAVRAGLTAGLERFERDVEAKVLILTAAGDQHFCAGADLVELAETGLRVPPADFIPQIGRTVTVTKPVIGAVFGAVRGGGFLLAQNCDLLIAASDATFAISEVKVGRGAPWAAVLPRLVPPAVAMQLLLTGEPITAQRAHEIGLVNAMAEPGEVYQAARRWAEAVRDAAPLAVLAARRMVHDVTRGDLAAHFAQAEETWRAAYESDDAQEGVKAFIAHRPPRWHRR